MNSGRNFPFLGRTCPSLLELCVDAITSDLSAFAAHLGRLPLELAHLLHQHIETRRHSCSLLELQVFCDAFWNPRSLKLGNLPGLNERGLTSLCFAKGLTNLDLSSCSWLASLDFLSELASLRCLNLRNCFQLPGDSLRSLYNVPHLECLDLKNVPSISNRSVACVIASLKELRALNISATDISDEFLEILTYGLKLKKWIEEQKTLYSSSGIHRGIWSTKGKKLPPAADMSVVAQVENMLQEWPCSNVIYLKMEQTKISEAAITHIFSLRELLLLDVRSTAVKLKSLLPVSAKYGLVASPSNMRLLARSNRILAATLRGDCGCSALDQSLAQSKDAKNYNLLWVEKWEQLGFKELLRASSSSSRN